MENDRVFNELAGLVTESRNPNTKDIDLMSSMEIVQKINEEDKKVALAIEKELSYISEAVEIVVESFKSGGRLIYVGAGTSGRLGVLDAAECPPTFGTDPEMVQGLIAGGVEALVKAQEGSEDLVDLGREDISAKNITNKDVVCGIAASRRTPYVIGAIEEAKRRGAKTLAVVCNPREDLSFDVDVAICPVPGPEVIMGSTRMKAGTAQKMVLNMITTAAMIRMGKVYENMMVDLQQNSKKLIERSKKIIMTIANTEYDSAESFLNAANGNVKLAIIMAKTGLEIKASQDLLDANEGIIRKAISSWEKGLA